MGKNQRDPASRLHPIEAFGNLPASRGEIRVEHLESRLAPKVPFPHRHDFFHFVLVEAGSGWHEIDFTREPWGSARRRSPRKPPSNGENRPVRSSKSDA